MKKTLRDIIEIILRIILIILIITVSFEYFPTPVVINWLAIIGIIFLFYRLQDIHKNNLPKKRREDALLHAQMFLSPYKNIWDNLKLSNKYCSLKLGHAGFSITGTEKTAPFRQFRIIESRVHNYETLWNMFCMTFEYNTSYDGLVESCQRYEAIIEESVSEQNIAQEKEKTEKNLLLKEKIDINNASVIEITALPGISIVMAKKLVKKREEINGFKSTEEIFTFLNLKPHLQRQLENLICVNTIEGNLKIERHKERKVDL